MRCINIWMIYVTKCAHTFQMTIYDAWIKDTFKVQDRPMDYDEIEYWYGFKFKITTNL